MSDTFILCIATIEEVVFAGDVCAVSAQGTGGWFGIRPNHAPLTASLLPHTVVITLADGTQTTCTVQGGVLEMRDNRMIILSDCAEMAKEQV